MTVNLEKPIRRRAFAVPALRPYARGWVHLGRALGTGSAALARRLRASTRLRSLLARARANWRGAARSPACWFCTAAGAVAAWSLVGRYVAVIAASAAAAWVLLALVHSTPAPVRSPAVEEPEQAPADGAPYDPREAFVQHLRRIIGNRSGVHLRELIKHPPLDGHTIAELRALCDRYQVPVRDRQRVGAGVTVGIRLTDLQALSPEDAQETPIAV